MTNPPSEEPNVSSQSAAENRKKRGRVKFPLIVREGNYIINPTPEELDEGLWGTDEENAIE